MRVKKFHGGHVIDPGRRLGTMGGLLVPQVHALSWFANSACEHTRKPLGMQQDFVA
jgi:hypothetical protein